MNTLVLTLPAQAPKSASSLLWAASAPGEAVIFARPGLTRRREGTGASDTTVGSSLLVEWDDSLRGRRCGPLGRGNDLVQQLPQLGGLKQLQ